MKKIQRMVVILFILALSLSGCGSFIMDHIEDTNGADDFSLASITDEEICQSRSHIAVASITTTSGGKTEIRIGKLSGVMQPDASLASVKASGETLVWHAASVVTSGNLRICIVRNGEEIAGEFPINGEGEIRIENAAGRYTLKIAGESAEFKTEITFQKSNPESGDS